MWRPGSASVEAQEAGEEVDERDRDHDEEYHDDGTSKHVMGLRIPHSSTLRRQTGVMSSHSDL